MRERTVRNIVGRKLGKSEMMEATKIASSLIGSTLLDMSVTSSGAVVFVFGQIERNPDMKLETKDVSVLSVSPNIIVKHTDVTSSEKTT